MKKKELLPIIGILSGVFREPLHPLAYAKARAKMETNLQDVLQPLYAMSDKWATKHLQKTLDTIIYYYNFEKWRAATNGTYNKECVYNLAYTVEKWKIRDEAEREHQNEIYRWRLFQDLVFCAVAAIVDFADEAEITLSITNADAIDETQEYFAVCEFAPTCNFAELPTFAHDITHDPESTEETNATFAETLKRVTRYTATAAQTKPATDEANTADGMSCPPSTGASAGEASALTPNLSKYPQRTTDEIHERLKRANILTIENGIYIWMGTGTKRQLAYILLCLFYGESDPQKWEEGEAPAKDIATYCPATPIEATIRTTKSKVIKSLPKTLAKAKQIFDYAVQAEEGRREDEAKKEREAKYKSYEAEARMYEAQVELINKQR